MSGLGIGLFVTALSSGYADLPKNAYSYSGEEYSVSEFYEQEVPNIYANGYYVNGNNTVSFGIDTGTHTKKLDTYGLNIGLYRTIPLTDNSALTVGGEITANFTEHRPCTDSYSREYYCGNLTSWKSFEGKTNETYNPEISIRYTYHF